MVRCKSICVFIVNAWGVARGGEARGEDLNHVEGAIGFVRLQDLIPLVGGADHCRGGRRCRCRGHALLVQLLEETLAERKARAAATAVARLPADVDCYKPETFVSSVKAWVPLEEEAPWVADALGPLSRGGGSYTSKSS